MRDASTSYWIEHIRASLDDIEYVCNRMRDMQRASPVINRSDLYKLFTDSEDIAYKARARLEAHEREAARYSGAIETPIDLSGFATAMYQLGYGITHDLRARIERKVRFRQRWMNSVLGAQHLETITALFAGLAAVGTRMAYEQQLRSDGDNASLRFSLLDPD